MDAATFRDSACTLGQEFMHLFHPLFLGSGNSVLAAAQALLSWCWEEGVSKRGAKKLFNLQASILPPNSFPTYDEALGASERLSKRFGTNPIKFVSRDICEHGCTLFEADQAESCCRRCGADRFYRQLDGSLWPKKVVVFPFQSTCVVLFHMPPSAFCMCLWSHNCEDCSLERKSRTRS